jgi:hypothetical protein
MPGRSHATRLAFVSTAIADIVQRRRGDPGERSGCKPGAIAGTHGAAGVEIAA